MSNREYKQFGIDVQSVSLISYKRTEETLIDIKGMCFSISLYEDIMGFVSINVGVKDAIGIIERLPLIGDEKIVISYKTPSLDDYIEVEFDVYKHSVLNRESERTRSYVIYGVTPETKIDLVSSVDEVYKLSGSETVNSIFQSFFSSKKTIPNPKEIEVSESFGTQYFSGNGRTPFSFIKYIAQESESEKYPASNYSFYETLEKKYYFKTFDELLDGEAVQNFYLSDSGKKEDREKEESDSIHPYQVITDVSVESGINGLTKTVAGGYRNAVKVVDPISKTFTEETFDYLKDTKLKQLSKHKIIPEEMSFLKDNTENIHTRLIRGAVYSEDGYIGSNVTEETDPQYFYPRRRHRFAHLDVASRALFDNISMNCTVSGVSDLHVGQVVNIFIPQESNDEEMLKMYNLFYGGQITTGGQSDAKFLVTKIAHIINFKQDTYTTTFTCVKNSFASKIETEPERVG